nr:MAG: wsv423-like protein [Penaeus semisulcatus pemonivirus]
MPYGSSSYSSFHSRERRYGEKSVPQSYNPPPYRSSSIASSWRKRHRPVSATPFDYRPNINRSTPNYRSSSSSVNYHSQVMEVPTSNGLAVSEISREQASATRIKSMKAAPSGNPSKSSGVLSSLKLHSQKSEQPTPSSDFSLLSSEGPLPLSAELHASSSSIRATKIPITLRTHWYSPYLLLKANAKNRHSPQDGLYETMIVERNGMKLTRWRTSQSPSYFTRVEYDTGLREKVSRTSNSLFHRYVAERGIIEPLKILLEKCENLHKEATNAICDALSLKYRVIPHQRENLVGWWPVGNDGMATQSSTCLNTLVFGNLAKNVINSNIEWNGISTRSMRNKLTQSILTLREMISVFHLSESAARRVLHGETSLLAEVSHQCRRWERERTSLQVPDGIPNNYMRSTKTISPNELYYECKFGVYFVPGRCSVFKFLTQQTLYSEFVWEVALGLSVAPIKGVVSIKNVCPEGFCFEMDFAGINLDEVINGDTNGLRQYSESPVTNPPVLQQCLKVSPKLTCLYAVRMMAARGDFQSCDPVLSERITTVYDTYHAGQIACVIREKLLDDLPFTMAEMVNIITRLSQQGIVNPDIKCDNFVIDPMTGQPFMIDFGLVIPEGSRSRTQYVYEPGQYPQSPKEYLSGKECTTNTMTFGLAYTFMDMLNTLLLRTGNPGVAAIYYNIEFLEWLSSAYSDIPKERPSIVDVATIIGKCFPLPSKVSELFDNPRQTLY